MKQIQSLSGLDCLNNKDQFSKISQRPTNAIEIDRKISEDCSDDHIPVTWLRFAACLAAQKATSSTV